MTMYSGVQKRQPKLSVTYQGCWNQTGTEIKLFGQYSNRKYVTDIRRGIGIKKYTFSETEWGLIGLINNKE